MKIIKDLFKCLLVGMGGVALFTWNFVPFDSVEAFGYNLSSLVLIFVALWILYRQFFKKKKQ